MTGIGSFGDLQLKPEVSDIVKLRSAKLGDGLEGGPVPQVTTNVADLV